jgi:methionyl-tRNA synthetase
VKADKKRAETVLAVLTNQVKDLSILVEPYLPATSAKISKQLNLELGKWEGIGKPIPVGHEIGIPKPLFRKLGNKEIEDLRSKFAGKKEEKMTFSGLDLEVGEILSVERHPDAEKLFVEKVRMGDGERQVVSGLVGHYREDQLIGKKVVIVKNLKPAKLRGVESQGMLLAAEGREFEPGTHTVEDDAVEVIFCDECEVGQKVMLRDEKSNPKPLITIKDFGHVKIKIDEFKVVSEGKTLVAGEHELKTKNVKKGDVC